MPKPSDSAQMSREGAEKFIRNYRKANGRGWDFPAPEELAIGVVTKTAVTFGQFEWVRENGTLKLMDVKTGKTREPNPGEKAQGRLVLRR